MATNWRNRAACRTEDPDLFFPVGNTGPAIVQTREAKAVCRRCPVMEACLQWALDTNQDTGVWGGLSEDERRKLRRRTRKAATQTQTVTAPEPSAATKTARKTQPVVTPEQQAVRQQVLDARTISRSNGCVEWQGSQPVTVGASRYTPRTLAWLTEHGELPSGHLALQCGNPLCVTPNHMRDRGVQTAAARSAVA